MPPSLSLLRLRGLWRRWWSRNRHPGSFLACNVTITKMSTNFVYVFFLVAVCLPVGGHLLVVLLPALLGHLLVALLDLGLHVRPPSAQFLCDLQNVNKQLTNVNKATSSWAGQCLPRRWRSWGAQPWPSCAPPSWRGSRPRAAAWVRWDLSFSSGVCRQPRPVHTASWNPGSVAHSSAWWQGL